MSRIEENQQMVNQISKARLKEIDSAALITVLTDISKSLAVIADSKVVYKKESDDDGK